MVKNHLVRLTAPKSWMLARKANRWTARPSPGPHALKNCLTVNLLLKDVLKLARTTREVEKILYDGMLKIDGIVRKNYKFPVGLMDVISIERLGENFRIILDNSGRFYALPISKEEANLKLLQIKNKRLVKGGKLQLTFHDGRTILVDKFEGFVGDSVLFDLNKKSIVELFKLEKGALIYLTAGKHVGKLFNVIDIIKSSDLQKAKVSFNEADEEITTLADYAFVVGKDKVAIKVYSEAKQKEAVKSVKEKSEKTEKIEKTEKKTKTSAKKAVKEGKE